LDCGVTDARAVVEDWLQRTEGPAFGSVSRMRGLAVRADGDAVAGIGGILDGIDRPARSVVWVLEGGAPRTVDLEATALAWAGPALLAAVGGTVRVVDGEAEVAVDGHVEALLPSPDGRAVAAIVRPDQPGRYDLADPPSGDEPIVFTGEPEAPRRLVRIPVDGATLGAPEPIDADGLTIWEAAWDGNDALVAVASEAPGETGWYFPVLVRIGLDGGVEQLHRPADDRQLASPVAGSGRIGVIEAVASDRGLVAGELVVVGPGGVERIELDGADATTLVASEGWWHLAGLRGLETVLADVDPVARTAYVRGLGGETFAGQVPAIAADRSGRIHGLLESSSAYPRVVRIEGDVTEVRHDLRHAGSDALLATAGTLEPVRWTATDGLEIEGLVAVPAGDGPHPLVVAVHGGPVAAWRASWGGQVGARHPYVPLLVERGYAVLLPNPRGSAGRGIAFADRVRGDLCGADTDDLLSGIDHLVEIGIADPGRLGVIGNSYGGTMAAWLTAASDRFGAAVSTSPSIDFVANHHTGDIPAFFDLFLHDVADRSDGEYQRRSPITHVDRMRTPVLTTAGLRDHGTPPGQAVALHQALRRRGVPTELVLYPRQGHGVAGFPDSADLLARALGWFDRWLRSDV
jgi:dipeptidyl aminopeptidase/acylaminoacyl peptidase